MAKKNGFVLWARQYSKRLLAALLILWGIGAIICAVYEFIRLFLTPETASMDSFYIYLAAPLTTGIPSYIIPNIYLNAKKVEKQYIPDYDARYLDGDGIGEDTVEIDAAQPLNEAECNVTELEVNSSDS